MRFTSPEFFYLLLLYPVLIAVFIIFWQVRAKKVSRFIDTPLLSKLSPTGSLHLYTWKSILFLVFFLFAIVALARPRFGMKMEMAERKGVDIMIALDISKSMEADDISPSRIKKAKHEIDKFIDLIKGDRIGLIVFAGNSYVQCPLTLDYAAARMFTDAVDTEWLQVQGTNLTDAINQARESFQEESKKYKVLIIISDGENHEGDPVKAAKKAADQGIRIFTVGVGSEKGVPIPVKQGRSGVTYKKDSQGNIVQTRLKPLILEQIAEKGNGEYIHAGINLDLNETYKKIEKMEEKNLGKEKLNLYKERYQLFLLLALIIIITEFFIPSGIRRKNE